MTTYTTFEYGDPKIQSAHFSYFYFGADFASGQANPVPVIADIAYGTVGVAYSEALAAQRGVSPYTYALLSGSLPAGLSLSSGVISGTPTTAGTSTFTIKATDAHGFTGSQAFSLTVNAASGGASPSNYGFAS